MMTTTQRAAERFRPAAVVDGGFKYDSMRTASKEWKELVSTSYGGLMVAEAASNSSTGSLKERVLDQLRVVELTGTPQSFRRTPALITSKPVEALTLSLIVEGTGRLTQDGRTCLLVPGDFCILDSSRPYDFEFLEPTTMIDFVWARQLLRISNVEATTLTAVALREATPLAPLLSMALNELTFLRKGLSVASAIGLAHGTAELVTAAVREVLPSSVNDGTRDRYEEIVRFIDDNLSDQDLSVDRVSEEFFISVRTLNRLFAKFDTSVAVTIRDRRLETSREMMLSRAYSDKSLGWIISNCGISSPQVFSRMFAAKFGESPSVYRQKHSDGLAA